MFCRLAKEKAEEHPLVIQQLGLPLTSGPWYNASLELTHAGHIASCKLTFHGRQSSSDILIRVRRPPGLGLANFESAACSGGLCLLA